MQRQIFISTIFMLAISGVIFFLKYTKQIYNRTSSLKTGNYLMFPLIEPQKDNCYIICLSPDNEYLPIMAKIGLRPTKEICTNGYEPLLKQVVAAPNDCVSVRSNGIYVNDRYIGNSQAKIRVNSIELHPLLPGYNHCLTDNEYFAMGVVSNSFDSRYFGVIHKDEIKYRAIYLWR